jgi:hypothetical protein
MRRTPLILLLPLALGLFCLLGTKASGHETVKHAVQIASVESTSPKSDPAPGTASEIQGYGQRERWNPELSEFAGGHHGDEVIFIGAGCGCLLIAVLVLVILL